MEQHFIKHLYKIRIKAKGKQLPPKESRKVLYIQKQHIQSNTQFCDSQTSHHTHQ